MTDKNLVPLPDGEGRNVRLSRLERRQRYIAERRQAAVPTEVEEVDQVPAEQSTSTTLFF